MAGEVKTCVLFQSKYLIDGSAVMNPAIDLIKLEDLVFLVFTESVGSEGTSLIELRDLSSVITWSC